MSARVSRRLRGRAAPWLTLVGGLLGFAPACAYHGGTCGDPPPPVRARGGSFQASTSWSHGDDDAGAAAVYAAVDKRVDVDLDGNRVVVRFTDGDGGEHVDTYRIVRPAVAGEGAATTQSREPPRSRSGLP